MLFDCMSQVGVSLAIRRSRVALITVKPDRSLEGLWEQGSVKVLLIGENERGCGQLATRLDKKGFSGSRPLRKVFVRFSVGLIPLGFKYPPCGPGNRHHGTVEGFCVQRFQSVAN
jgi:hypothetical protein